MGDASEGFFTPPPPPKSASPPRILIVGAGSRGQTYARSVTSVTNGVVVAVAEPDPYRRGLVGKECIAGWGGPDGAYPPPKGSSFANWREFVAWERARRERAAAASGNGHVPEGIDAAFVCVQDEMHREVVLGLAELGGIHIMCEKPLATRLADCVEMYRALRRSNAPGAGQQQQRGLVFSIGHVMRYSPHNMELRRLLLQDRVVGEILDVVHTEPIGHWHFAHSYVRGNWRREDTSAPSLLAKCCHDVDLLLWLLCSPPTCAAPTTEGQPGPHIPSTVSSSGSLKLFKQSRKPREAGAATNCLSCPIESSCQFSAKRIYVDGNDGDAMRSLDSSNRDWPVDVVLPDIESYGDKAQARAALLAELAKDYGSNAPDSAVRARNWFGRCVWESDNDVCDSQVVTITWDEEQVASPGGGGDSGSSPGRGAKTATLHMVAQTKKICQRYTHVYGEHGEVYADSATITVEDFRTGRTTVHRPRLESLGHGGGDNGLARQFVLAVDRVKNHGWDADRAQREHVGCTLDDVLRSHAVVFCAEDARKGRAVVDFGRWWRDEVEAGLAAE
ncbi:hypothetical protein GGTG_09666 [Gaeumannomyces tritici R3-111a-1]|uniref:Gfo/Idh/MocA-like oxidoreductase N-terminal domain-containing protein n=1 Tax=Gaeumannomyces tritici (strain R3-111a-1) TaxID=644352 RepID=J3P828_GAET3|nr:hypothetical protein GGTG_09666 [Gaeumannomyces tritici R3-111a-1]EJT72811.1 hypothetical protein GGTG_09666 [Gaeumannomyces tritici R3-111a-1]